MHLIAKTASPFLVCAGLLMTGLASPALGAGSLSDFEGVWDTVLPEVNAEYRLYLHVEGNKVEGNFDNSDSPKYNGTLQGTVGASGVLQYTCVQPKVGAKCGGWFTVESNGTISGETYSLDAPDKKYRWEGTPTAQTAASRGTAPPPSADLILGTFGMYFCGAAATFEVTSKEDNRWVFYGMIRIQDTGEYNELSITQFEDNSLRITRRLTDSNSGPRQTVETAPPIFEGRTAVFHADGGRGAGCNNPGAFTDLRIPY